MSEIKLQGVSKRFGATEAVKSLDLIVGDGKFVVLLGPTGAGKTTTLRLVAGLEQPDAGQVHIAGQDVTAAPPSARDVAFVFQQYSLYPHLTVFENMAFALRAPIRRVPEAEIQAKVREVARLLHIEAKLDNKATQLSGGQMQRVAIARALVGDPGVLLVDEPTGNLDLTATAEILELLDRLHDQGRTIVMITHEEDVAEHADRRLVLGDGILHDFHSDSAEAHK
jgi:multiple sugar transport system ATP-binding protein